MTPCSTAADPLGVADPWLKTTALNTCRRNPNQMPGPTLTHMALVNVEKRFLDELLSDDRTSRPYVFSYPQFTAVGESRNNQ